MREIGTIEIIVAGGAAAFAFVVSLSTRTHRTRAAAITSLIVSILLLVWDRYLYVSTSRGLLDTLTCSFTPTARPCQDNQDTALAASGGPPAQDIQNAAPNSEASNPSAGQADEGIERTIRLDDQNSKSIWTTSVYSYAPGGGGPGGGLADDRLRVGGWGDTYNSLISTPVQEPGRRVRRATLILRLRVDDAGSSPTPIRLMRITQSWGWNRGDRLWWRNAPQTEFVSNLPAPTNAEGEYEIDLTDLYNRWALNQQPNFGIMLSPVLTNNNFTTFYSTRAPASVRPLLRLVY